MGAVSQGLIESFLASTTVTPKHRLSAETVYINAAFVVNGSHIGLFVDLNSDKKSSRVGKGQGRAQGQKPGPRMGDEGRRCFHLGPVHSLLTRCWVKN